MQFPKPRLSRWPEERPRHDVDAERIGGLRQGIAEVPWYVRSAYTIETNKAGFEVVVGHGDSREYYPIAHPRLPFELAHVEFGDRKSLLTFVHQWGVLGEDRFRPYAGPEPRASWHSSDSLDFVWAHARTVRHVLTLYDALLRDDSDALADAMRNLAVPTQSLGALPALVDEVPPHLETAPWWAARGDIVLFDPRCWSPSFGFVQEAEGYWPPGGYGVEGAAAETIADFIAGNVSGIRATLYMRDQPWHKDEDVEMAPPLSRIRFAYAFDALIEAAWWHLANVVTDRGDVGRCRQCGHQFGRTDKRQEFCPPLDEHVLEAKLGNRQRAVSQCASRSRTRKYRSQSGRTSGMGEPESLASKIGGKA